MNYIFKLMCKQGYEIDSTTLLNCVTRLDAIKRANNIMTSQGLKITKYKYSLKQVTT